MWRDFVDLSYSKSSVGRKLLHVMLYPVYRCLGGSNVLCNLNPSTYNLANPGRPPVMHRGNWRFRNGCISDTL